MSAPSAATLFTEAGTTTYGHYDNNRRGVIRCRSTFTADTTATLPVLPANAKVLWAQSNISTALVYSTAVRYGIGTTAMPCAFLISGTGTTVGTAGAPTTLPVRNEAVFPIFSNSVLGAVTNVAAQAAVAATTGQATASIPANFLKPGDIVRIRCQGLIGWGTDGTAVVKMLFGASGSSDIAGQTATITPADGDTFGMDIDIHITAVGTAGEWTSAGRTYIGTKNVVAGAADGPAFTFLGATAVDTTVATLPVINITFSTTQAAHTIKLDQLSIEVIRPQLPVSSSTTALIITSVDKQGISAGSITSGVIDSEIHFEEMAPMTAT